MCKWQCDNLDLCLAYTTSTFLVLSCEVTYGGVCGMLGNLTTNKMLSSRPIVFTCSKIDNYVIYTSISKLNLILVI